MPRTGRGGRRTGSAGRSYSNRSDLQQAVKVAPSRTYGEGVASAAAQKALPLPQAPAVPTGAPPSPGPMPGQMPINRPTERPAEPVTSGMTQGAGPGPSATMPSVDPVIETLRAAYRAFPNESTGALLEALEK